jgi:membrane protein
MHWASDLAKETLRSYSRHGGRMLAAAVAFSSLLSVAPLLVIALHVAGAATGEERARASLLYELSRWVGADGAETVRSLLDRVNEERSHAASVASGAVLVYGSTRLFSQLKRALNVMWDIQARSGEGLRGKVWKQLRKRAIAFLMVLGVGVVVVGVVVAETVLSTAAGALGSESAQVVWRAGEMLLSLACTTLLFGATFKVLPDAEIAWRDAWRGALVTGVLFSVGAYLIGLYLGHKALSAMYGAAGSVVMLLLWVSYSAQVFFLGAAWTGELARASGRPIEPNERGVKVRVEE